MPAVDEIIRLDNIALEAQRESTLNLVIVIYGGKHTYPNEVGGHIARITDYLNRLRGVSSDNLLIINGGYRDTAWLECWFLPKNLEPPQPAPEVAGRDLVYDRKPPDMSEWDRTLSQLKQGK